MEHYFKNFAILNIPDIPNLTLKDYLPILPKDAIVKGEIYDLLSSSTKYLLHSNNFKTKTIFGNRHLHIGIEYSKNISKLTPIKADIDGRILK